MREPMSGRTAPDSNGFGRAIDIGSLNVDESDPPFRFRNVRGRLKLLADSAWLDFLHWDLPASSGAAKGKVVWGGPLPIRYDVAVRGDSVALNDVNWVYPNLPKTGGGKVLLTISNKRDVHVMDYKLAQMDMRSDGSHLTGDMTFGVGAPVLQLRNVDLIASPLDFTFIHTMNGKPLPIDWEGQIYGSVRASGGPLTDFEVDAARAEWRDSHVPGAVSRFSGSGGRQPSIRYGPTCAFTTRTFSIAMAQESRRGCLEVVGSRMARTSLPMMSR